jgi:hypothetical protein
MLIVRILKGLPEPLLNLCAGLTVLSDRWYGLALGLENNSSWPVPDWRERLVEECERR